MKDQNLTLPSPLAARAFTPGLASGGFDATTFPHSPTAPSRERGVLSCPLTKSSSPRSSTFESPTRVRQGTYVAFAIATNIIAEQLSEGSDVRETVRKFPRKFYIGLVTDSFMSPIDDYDGIVNEVVIHFVTRATPSPQEPSEYCLAMHPTADDRVESPSLRTRTFFPYVDCKQWTVMGVKVTVGDVHESSLSFALEDDDFARFEDMAVMDYALFDRKEQTCGGDLRIKFPLYSVVAEIWKDIRVGDPGHEPSKFAEEVQALESIVTEC